MTSKSLGIVVIGRNEGDRLIRCLKSVRNGTDIDTVYVDSGSTDGSVDAATQLEVAVVDLDMSRPFSAARARNEGFAALIARCPNVQFVQFVDGDCELVPSWLDTALAFFERRMDVALVCGRRRELRPEASIYNGLCDIEWHTPIGEATVCGGDTMIRAEAFKAVGGFKAELIAGEEPELCLRLREIGWKIWRINAEMTRHDAAITRFGQWWVRTVRSGYAFAEVSQLHKHSKFRIFAENVKRAIIWAGLIPLGIIFGILFHPAAAVGILIYPLQVLRLALRQGNTQSASRWNALFTLVGKFPELQGILKFQVRRLSGRSIPPIEYK